MLCQKCQKNKAVYFYSENVNGKAYSVALCDECKKKHFAEMNEHKSGLSFGLFNGGLFQYPLGYKIHPTNGYQKREKCCSACGSTFSELALGKRSFCTECYSQFHDELSEFLIRIHGSDRHTGKTPEAYSQDECKNKCADNADACKESETDKCKDDTVDKIAILRNDLKSAISEERYEDAARIRDEIKRMEESK